MRPRKRLGHLEAKQLLFQKGQTSRAARSTDSLSPLGFWSTVVQRMSSKELTSPLSALGGENALLNYLGKP